MKAEVIRNEVSTHIHKQKQPDFFIVGAAKSGTTSMCQYLRQHPEIFMPKVRRINFFGKDLYSPRDCQDKETYLSLFSDANDAKRIGESSLTYLYSRRAVYEIHNEYPTAKIIIMLRNPVDAIYALHSQLLFSNVEEIEKFSDALEAEEGRKKGKRIPVIGNKKHAIEWLFYRESVKYTEQVKRYVDVFGWENVHIIIFDDFINNTEEVYEDVLQYLDVDANFKPEFQIHNPNTVHRSRKINNLINNPPSTLRQILKRIKPLRPMFVLLSNFLTLLNVQKVKRSPIPPEIRRQLQLEFKPEVENLGNLLGKDLSYWYNN